MLLMSGLRKSGWKRATANYGSHEGRLCSSNGCSYEPLFGHDVIPHLVTIQDCCCLFSAISCGKRCVGLRLRAWTCFYRCPSHIHSRTFFGWVSLQDEETSTPSIMFHRCRVSLCSSWESGEHHTRFVRYLSWRCSCWLQWLQKCSLQFQSCGKNIAPP